MALARPPGGVQQAEAARHGRGGVRFRHGTARAPGAETVVPLPNVCAGPLESATQQDLSTLVISQRRKRRCLSRKSLHDPSAQE